MSEISELQNKGNKAVREKEANGMDLLARFEWH